VQALWVKEAKIWESQRSYHAHIEKVLAAQHVSVAQWTSQQISQALREITRAKEYDGHHLNAGPPAV